MNNKERIIPKGIVWPYILLTTLFFAWAVPNNLTDTMLAAFKRIMRVVFLFPVNLELFPDR